MDTPGSIAAFGELPQTFRFQQALAQGVHRSTLARWQRQGIVERVTRGVYRKADAVSSNQDDLVVVASRVPNCVFCLESALYFHELGTRIPHQVMISVERDSRTPAMEYPPVRCFRVSGKAFTEGVEIHQVGDAALRIYGKSKTVADCFKYRNKLGLDVALEALRALVREPGFVAGDLLRYCRICHVEKVVAPYLEALL